VTRFPRAGDLPRKSFDLDYPDTRFHLLNIIYIKPDNDPSQGANGLYMDQWRRKKCNMNSVRLLIHELTITLAVGGP